jgi:tetratricopeptide (TPR) repeat protein
MAEGRFSKLEKTSQEGEGNSGAWSPPHGAVARSSNKPTGKETSHPNEEDLYPTFLRQADELFFTGQYREALRNYSRALQQENNLVYPWIGQISSLIEMKQYREAELWSNKALEQFPEDPSLLGQRARVLAVTGNLKRAIGVCDYAMGKGATKWTWLARGEVLLAVKDGNALFCFEKAIEDAGPEDWRTPLLAGRAFARRRQWATAEDFFRKAAEINPRNYYIWYELANVLIELNYMDRARDAIERSIQLKPDFRPAKDLELKIYRRPFLQRVLGVFRR